MGHSGEAVYAVSVMNENSSSNSSTSAPHHGLTAEAISRRAYELWEQEGRPENRDLHHWLRAEKELLAQQDKSSPPTESAGAQSSRDSDWLQPEKDLLQQNRNNTGAASSGARAQNTDQPLQSARQSAGGKSAQKRSSAAPFSSDKSSGRATPPSTTRAPGRG